MAKRRVKAGTGKQATAARKARFVVAYISNGGNATQAAIQAGYAASGAEAMGSRLTRDNKVSKAIAEATEKAAGKAGLSVERTLLEVSRLAYSDPRKLYDKDGQLIPVHLLDDDTAATVASVEVDEEFSGRGEARELTGYIKKIKHWDKNAALEKAMKYHGLYKEDNKQIGESLALRVVFGK